MKFKIEAECSPLEARAFLGLPDLTPLNQHIVEEMKTRIDANLAMLQPDEMMKSWLSLGGQAQDQFAKMLTATTGSVLGAQKPKR